MSGTEAAASLFGSADTSSDPFATLGTEYSQEASDDLFGGASTDHPAKADAANVFDSPPEQQATTNDSVDTSHSLLAAESHGYTPNSYTPAYNVNALPEAHGTHDPRQQWGGNQTYHGADNASYDANKYVSPVAYDPYVPPQATNYIPSNYQPPPPQTAPFSYPGNQVSTYDNRHIADPYAPTQPANQSAYSPYDPYALVSSGKSSVSSQQLHAIPPASSYSSPPPASKTNLSAVPAPPVPTTTQISRPKVSNAYDPPFPVASYGRRNVSGPVKYGQGHNTPAHSAYTAYQPANSASLPPPPSRVSASTTPSPQPRAPEVPPASLPPPPRPSSKPHDYASTYTPATTQPSSFPQHRLANDTVAASTGTSPPAPTTHTVSVSPTSIPLSEPSGPRHDWVYSQGSSVQYDKEHTLPDTFSNAESASSFFNEISQPGDPARAEPALEEPFELQPAPARVASPLATTSPIPKPTKPQSPNGSISSSPQQSFKAVSPPSVKASMESGRFPSPRQSPRPPSSSSPVYGLPHPRASPDLRKEAFSLEHIPRSKTTSPSIDGTPTNMNPYAPPPQGSTLRTKSASMNSADRVSSPELSPSAVHDRYAPRGSRVSNAYGIDRTGSPSSFSARSSDSQHNVNPQPGHYLPPVSESSSHTPATFSQEPPSIAEGPYAPSQHNHAVKSASSHSSYGQSPYAYSTDLSAPQELNTKPTITPYAPSPSLLGANDPLGRTSVRVPVVSFGFGGKIVTCFHDAGSLNTGFDVALSSRTSSKVQVQSWKKVVPESALDSAVTFPGPLHADPGPPGTGLMKAAATTQAKTKKTSLLKYLSDRADEITQGLGYLHSGSAEKRTAEGKLVLVKLLKIMVDNDGHALGTPQLDSAVRAALVPRLEGMTTNDSGAHFTTTADAAGLLAETPYGTANSGGSVAPISVTTLQGTNLDKIEEFLLRGERRQAYHYALDEKLWAHAMVIASSIDKEAWKEVVNEFIRADLGVKGDSPFTLPSRVDSQAPSVNGREGLRVAYGLFSGQGAAAVQELVPKSVLARVNGRLPIPAPTIPAPTIGQPTPRTPNFTLPAAGAKIPAESLSKWAETVAMLLVSPLTPDASATLTALGDQLLANGWLEAAHVCFLLSPQTSPVGGVGNPAARIVLLGSKNPANVPTFSRDSDSIVFTEILEHALATAPVPKGQEPNHGFPHLQAYRLIRAYAAAEAGDLGVASRYCEAITASLVRGSVYFTPTMLEQLKNLADRLSGVSHSDKSSSWMPGKISKPSLDTIGGWLEGRFTKLVTGESDSPASPQEDASKQDGTHGFVGPFAHYNTISSTTSSARSSPAPTFVTPAYALPPRTGSAMSNKAPYGYGIDRASSAMEPIRRKHSPQPLVPPPHSLPPAQAMSAGATMTSFPSIQTQLGNYSHGNSSGSPYSNGYSPGSDLQTPRPSNHNSDYVGDEANVQEVTWWGSSAGYGNSNDNGKTPTVAHFEKVEETHVSVDNNGFFSPMMNQTFSIGPHSSSSSTPVSGRGQSSSYEEDVEDDLGLGNSSKKKNETASEGGVQANKNTPAPAPAAAPAKEAEKKPDAPAQSSGGWLSRWWRKENTSGGPVKASLGEESSFYYDQELKRWVNKKVGAEAPKPTPTLPPPRAQTASPAMLGGHSKPPPPPGGPSTNGNVANGHGLGRPASAIDLTTSPPTSKPIMRVRSNLAPPGLDSAPPTPTGTRIVPGSGPASGPSPPIRPKSSTSAKKNVRSRYVDVFAAEAGGSSA